jgi:putative toxin-antitoxin system antitoxin component (TIGR02293 family)
MEDVVLATYDAEAIAEVMGLEDGHGTAAAWREGKRSRGVVGLREEARPFAGRSASAVSIEAAVEDGLPRAALRHVAEWLAGNDAAKIAGFEWAVVPKTTLDRRTGKLSVPESERTERIARLAVQARRALGSDGEARIFMTTPHPELDGRTPMEAARTDLGARRTERILLALEYGLAL